jgi:hypothetical protein
MALKQKVITKRLLALSFFITIFMLVSLVAIGVLLDRGRERFINTQVNRLYQDFNNMQVYELLRESYDDKMACLAFESKIIELDYYVWKLGEKIDAYRIASEEFQKDPYYLEQKQLFNENEIFYMLLLKKMNTACNLNKSILIFFYQNSEDCKKCDDQSFILRDISLLEEDDQVKSVAIFSLDMDLNITTLKLLEKYYQVNEYPCVIIDEQPYCGIRDRSFIMKKICEKDPDANVCIRYTEAGGKI